MIFWLTLITSAQNCFDKKKYAWNNWKLSSNRQWTQWRCNTFQWMNIKQPLLIRPFWHAMHALIHYIWLSNSDVLFPRIDPKTGYDKSHRLKQRPLIGQPSLRMSVSLACPSGRIQGWCGRRSVSTKNRYNYMDKYVRVVSARFLTVQ